VYGPDVYEHPYFKVPEAQLPAELNKVRPGLPSLHVSLYIDPSMDRCDVESNL
jgi:hypothetical protein